MWHKNTHILAKHSYSAWHQSNHSLKSAVNSHILCVIRALTFCTVAQKHSHSHYLPRAFLFCLVSEHSHFVLWHKKHSHYPYMTEAFSFCIWHNCSRACVWGWFPVWDQKKVGLRVWAPPGPERWASKRVFKLYCTVQYCRITIEINSEFWRGEGVWRCQSWYQNLSNKASNSPVNGKTILPSMTKPGTYV
jgi:hypothetical protein